MRAPLLGLVAGLALASAPQAMAQDKPIGERLYDVVASGLPNGPVPGHRANHIKGAVFEGSFTATPEAATLSIAQHLQGAAIPLVIRFSNVGGIPDVPDNSPATSVRAMSLTFNLPGGTKTSLICINMPFFISKTPEDFIGLNLAGQSKAPKDAHPTPFEQWAAAHPETKAFLSYPRPMPASFGTQDYYAIHAYKLTDAAGTTRFVRFHIVPEAGRQFLTPDAAAKTEPNVLFDDIRARVAKAPVTYRLEVQLAEPGDPTNDPTVSWPDTRKVVTLGMISVTAAVPDNDAAEKALVFMPNEAIPGLALSDDPFLEARAAVYAVGYDKRK